MNQTEIDNLNITKITIWLDEHNITKYSIRKENMDFYVDVHDSVNLSNSKISHIPFKFGVIDNDFCIDNNLLTNCESLPQIVKKDFSMHNNKIENFHKSNIKEIFGNAVMSSNQINDLENIPIVHSSLNLNHNKLSSLKHLPEYIYGNLSVSKNLLTNLDYLPLLIKGDFICAFNKVSAFSDLQTTTILGSLIMEYNNLTNCVNIPKVYNSIDLSHNFITTLQGLNHQKLDSLNLNFNQLTSLEFCPNTIKSSLSVNYNQLKNLPNKQNKEIIQENKNNKKSFLLLALKSIYDENSKNQFLSDNINHEYIQSVPKEKLSIEEIQKKLFEQFLGDKLENNIRKATALRQNLEEKNNIKLKF